MRSNKLSLAVGYNQSYANLYYCSPSASLLFFFFGGGPLGLGFRVRVPFVDKT